MIILFLQITVNSCYLLENNEKIFILKTKNISKIYNYSNYILQKLLLRKKILLY
jgi:hypothetical protein